MGKAWTQFCNDILEKNIFKLTLSNSRKSFELAGFKIYLESFFQTLGLEFEDPPHENLLHYQLSSNTPM